MKRIAFGVMAAGLIATGSTGFAASKKEQDCKHQADIVRAVQQARMNRVAERKVTETVLAGEVTWPERFNPAIAIFAGEMYKFKRRDLQGTDQAKAWFELCLAN